MGWSGMGWDGGRDCAVAMWALACKAGMEVWWARHQVHRLPGCGSMRGEVQATPTISAFPKDVRG